MEPGRSPDEPLERADLPPAFADALAIRMAIDPDGLVLYAARSILNHLHANADDVIGRHLTDLLPTTWHAPVQDLLGEAAAEPSHPHHCLLELPAETTHRGYLAVTALAAHDGELRGFWLLGRKVDDKALLAELMSVAEERGRALVNAVPVAVALVDDDHRILRANTALAELVGIPSAAQLLGRCLADFVDVQRATADPVGAEQRLVRVDGSIRWVRARRLSFAARQLDQACCLVTLDDVTTSHELAMETQHSQRLEAMGRLAAGVAHEINTPIQFIGDNITFLAEAIDSLIEVIDVLVTDVCDATSNVPRAERVAAVEALLEAKELDYYRTESPAAVVQAQEGVARVAKIVRAMKALGHPDQQEKVPTDIEQILQYTVTVTRGSIKHDAEVQLHLGGLPRVWCIPGELSQVFLNLIINAADAIREHRGSSGLGTIRVATAVDGEDAVITVSDDGGGIPLDAQPLVFEPFFTTKGVGRGTGQGLALARQVVTEQHGGSITFTSVPGTGTTFTIRLPLATPDSGEVAA